MSAKNWSRGGKLNVGSGCWVDGLNKVSGGAVGRDML